MLARRMTPEGMDRFNTFLNSLRNDPSLDAPLELLTGSVTSVAIDADVDAEPREFLSRLEIAEHLGRILKNDASSLRTDALREFGQARRPNCKCSPVLAKSITTALSPCSDRADFRERSASICSPTQWKAKTACAKCENCDCCWRVCCSVYEQSLRS